MKCALHFATKLNSRDIKKYVFVFGYPPMIKQSLDPPNEKFLDPPLVYHNYQIVLKALYLFALSLFKEACKNAEIVLP